MQMHDLPDARGHFGPYGGVFVAETLSVMGLIHFENKAYDKALREFRRVLKPGGRFACLEFSHMTHRMLQDAYDAYSFKVIPSLGELVTGDKASYQYLIESIRRFPNQDDFADRIRAAGFSGVGYQNYSGGIACMHTGWAV